MLFKTGGHDLGSRHKRVQFYKDLALATLILRIQFKKEIPAKETEQAAAS